MSIVWRIRTRRRGRRGRRVGVVWLRAVQRLVDGVLGHGVVRQRVDLGVGVVVVVDGVGGVGQGVVRDWGGSGAVAVVT